MPKASRVIPGTTWGSVTRGGGQEQVEWARNGVFNLQRDVTSITPGYRTDGSNNEPVYLGVVSLSGPATDGDTTILANGTEAMNRAVPLSPSVSLLTSAGELAADGAPNPNDFLRWEAGTRNILRQAAGNYVGVQFAWLPLLAEIKSWARQVERSNQILAEAKASRAKPLIRTGYSYPVDQGGTSSTTQAYIGRSWNRGSISSARAVASASSSWSKKTWYEAIYMNLNPVQPDQYTRSQEYALKAKHLLGLELSPEFLWELAPWSWAVDWFTNFGDVLSSVSDFISDGLVLKQGFIMHHTSSFSTNSCPGFTAGAPYYSWGAARTARLMETKKRFRALPFIGFGPSVDLTDRQKSILAALAINKLA